MRKIIHIDMDCFYAAVEMRDRPELRGKPVGVGGPPEGRGVLTTANYEARKFGVRSAMASATAIRICPQLIIVRPDFAKYKKASRAVREILARYTPHIEPLSLDEAYLDVTEASVQTGMSATQIAKNIRVDIRKELGLTASAGVASNKFLAKIAGEINKPDGLKVVRPSDVEEFMKTLPIEKIWGVGKVTAKKMRDSGIATCGDLQKFSVSELTARYGTWGARLYDFARGLDDRSVKADRERKSLSVEETYGRDLKTLQECLAKLPGLYDDWDERMVRSGDAESIRGISVKLKFSDFKSLSRDRVFQKYPTQADFKELLIEAFNAKSEPIRLIGIGVRLDAPKRTSSGSQLKLF